MTRLVAIALLNAGLMAGTPRPWLPSRFQRA